MTLFYDHAVPFAIANSVRSIENAVTYADFRHASETADAAARRQPPHKLRRKKISEAMALNIEQRGIPQIRVYGCTFSLKATGNRNQTAASIPKRLHAPT
jgi:hypothetical protein